MPSNLRNRDVAFLICSSAIALVLFGSLACRRNTDSVAGVDSNRSSTNGRIDDGAIANGNSEASQSTERTADRSPSFTVSHDATIERLRKDIEWLADDQRRGRGPHSEGLEASAHYLQAEFREIGLEAVAGRENMFQDFRPRNRWMYGDQNELSIDANGESIPLVIGTDYRPLPGSLNESFDLPIVFAGYGITAPEFGYDDYEGIDVAGKAVLVLRHEPQLVDDESLFLGRELTDHAHVYDKIDNAIEHGAAAILFCTDIAHLRKQQNSRRSLNDSLLSLRDRNQQPVDIHIAHIHRDHVKSMIESYEQGELASIEAAIDEDLSTRSFPLADHRIQGSIEINREREVLRNVIAVIPGAGELAEETIVIGAHYDHVGMGQFGSLAPWTAEIHNGADDNASGTSMLLELARRLQQRSDESRRQIVFIAFSGEELGLLGSEFYCRSPLVSLSRTKAMLNLDMVGRLPNNLRLDVYGTGTSPGFRSLVGETLERHELNLRAHPEGYGPSDHESFYVQGIPVLHFFTGLHEDYHRPSDDFDKINYEGMFSITRAVETILWSLATTTDFESSPTEQSETNGERPVFGTTDGSSNTDSDGEVQGTRFPTNLDMNLEPAASGRGLRVVSMTTGGAGYTAQFRANDVILSVDEIEIDSLDQWQAYLSDASETIFVVVQRGRAKLRLAVRPSD